MFITGHSTTLCKMEKFFLYGLCYMWLCHLVTGSNNTLFFLSPENSREFVSLCETEQCWHVSDILNRSIAFKSHTTLVFLPGEHVIEMAAGEIIIENVTNFTITGYHSAYSSNVTTNPSIKCYKEFGMIFVRVKNITVSNITIRDCGIFPTLVDFAALSTKAPLLYNLFVMTSTSVTIDRVFVSNGTGIGLRILDVTGDIVIKNSHLSGNEINCLIEFTQDYSFSSITPNPRALVTIVKTHFTHGRVYYKPIDLYLPNDSAYATGLTIMAYQKTYTTKIDLTSNLFVENSGTWGNVYLFLTGCGSNVSIYNTNLQYSERNVEGFGGHIRLVGLSTCRVFTLVRVTLSITRGHFERACLKIVYDNSARVFLNNFAFEAILSQVSIEKTSCISLRLEHMTMVKLHNVNITGSLGNPALEAVDSSILLAGGCLFHRNNGGLILYENTRLTLEENSTTKITENKNTISLTNQRQHIYGTPFYAVKAQIEIRNNTSLTFDKNSAILSGGMTLVNSDVSIHGTTTLSFSENSGGNGGGLAMHSGFISFNNSNANLCFIGNTAHQRGGGMYVDDTEYLETASNTFTNTIMWSLNSTPMIYFRNNSANLAGSDLYGGWIDWIMFLSMRRPFFRRHIIRCNNCLKRNISSLFNFPTDTTNDHSLVASDPTRVCVCYNSIPQCNETVKNVSVYIGQAFTIPVVAVGQRLGTAPTIIQAQFASSSVNGTTVASTANLADGETAQIVTKYCTNLTYTVISLNTKEKLLLTTDTTHTPTVDTYLQQNFPQYALLYKQFSIDIQLNNCTLGFYYNRETQTCKCDQIFMRYGIQCDTQSFSITKPSQMWVNATFTHLREMQTSGVLVHEHCPYDYCNTATDTLTINLSSPDSQCNYKRSGILCGSCRKYLSHVFGSSNCRECSNLWLLLIPVFGVAGIVLVVVLIRLDLTVAIGTINGLIFYANIVQANREIFFPPENPNSFLNVFIAWINLDIGMEVCFYNGLNAYVKTWLQLFFPLYIWVLVITIIMTSRHSTTAARLSGTNAVQVLATLFLLSYTKLLRFIITVLSPTILTYPNSFLHPVWLNDGNINYFQGKHIPLVLIALSIVVLLSLPYTMVLLFIQCLQRCPDYKFLFWVRKFKPLFDAYTGPYKETHRYWTGLLLLVRVLLLIVFSANIFGNPAINLLAIVVTVTMLLGYLSQIGGVYESKIMNLIEIFYLTNLNILSAATLLNTQTEGNQKSVAVIVSTSLSLSVFAVIVSCHGFVAIVPSRKRARLEQWLKSKLQPAKKKTIDRIIPLQQATRNIVTHSTIQLREPLLKEE